MTLRERLAEARARLVAAGIPDADAALDVDLYARTILGWDRARLITEWSAGVPAALEPRFSEWIARRERREPSAYIVGNREFWSLDFVVTPAVLIPRPETELIVEAALGLLRSGDLKGPGNTRPGSGDRSAHLADIGTGSGCLAVSIAHGCPGIRVVATDISGEALEVARLNAARHGVAHRIEFVRTSYLDGIDGPFNVIVTNPPYVREGDRPALARDVRHEPEVALFGGADGLGHIRGVLDTAGRALTPGGWLLMEFGYGQDDDVGELVAAHPLLSLDRMLNDLLGIPRTAVIQRRAR